MNSTQAGDTDRRHQDRKAYLEHDRLAHSLRIEARGFQAIADHAADLLPSNADRLARARCELLRRGYAQLAEDFEDLAAEAASYRDSYWSLLTGEPS